MKRSENEDSLQVDAEKVMTQIRERDYDHGMNGQIILYGIPFLEKCRT